MPHRPRTLIAAALLALGLVGGTASSHAAADWSGYGNPRFCYVVDVPPGFAVTSEADNGDGATLDSAETGARLLAWGTNLAEGDFASDVAGRVESYGKEGWNVTLQRVAAGHASVSGSKGGQIVYLRGIDLGGDQAAYVEITYPQAQVKAFDPIIDRLARSLAKGKDCGAR